MPRLNFTMRHQLMREWCWATTSVSVDKFFDDNSAWTECKMAEAELGVSCCPSLQACNRVHPLDPPLTRVQRLRGPVLAKTLTFDEIKAEILAGNPICVRVQWSDGGGHFAAIVGYDVTEKGLQRVYVADPFYGDSTASYDGFVSKYQGEGKWTHTFLLGK
jgi:hypothetical protein